jgi:hypothetical protein
MHPNKIGTFTIVGDCWADGRRRENLSTGWEFRLLVRAVRGYGQRDEVAMLIVGPRRARPPYEVKGRRVSASAATEAHADQMAE